VSVLFYICEYFSITPAEFFDAGNSSPETIREFIAGLNALNPDQLANIVSIVKGLKKYQIDLRIIDELPRFTTETGTIVL